MRILYPLALVLVFSVSALAQNNFRSRQSGDWNVAATWEEFVGGTWQLTANTPDFNDGSISIQNGHVVTLTSNETIDQATVQVGGTLEIEDLIVLTLNNGAGNDLRVLGAIVFFGESFIDGAGNFVLNGNLFASSLNATGALVSGTTAGNLRINNRAYNTGSRVIYTGTGPQFIGSGHPSTKAVTEIANDDGVTFNTTTSGNSGAGRIVLPLDLILTSGNFNVISNASVARILYLGGNVIANTNFITFSGPNVDLYIVGDSDFGIFPFNGATTMRSLIFQRVNSNLVFGVDLNITRNVTNSGDIVFNGATSIGNSVAITSGTIDFNNTASIAGNLNISNGTTLFFEDQAFSLVGDFNSTGGLLSANSNSSLSVTGSVALSTPLEFSPSGNELGALVINKTNPVGTSVVISSPLTVTTTFTLSRGVLSIVNNSLVLNFNVNFAKSGQASIITSSPGGGPWRLTYTGPSQSTGLEIPANGILQRLTINTLTASEVTLSQPITVVQNFAILANGRTFTAGANAITVGVFSNGGTFNAPAGEILTVDGNFVNNRTFNHNNGTVLITDNCVMSGSFINTTNFNNLIVSAAGNLTAPATLNINGQLEIDGGFNAGAGRVIFNNPSTTLSGTNINAIEFNDLTISPGVAFTPATLLTLSGELRVNGTYNSNGNTLVCAGNCQLAGNAINAVVFEHVSVNPGSSLTVTSMFTLTGDLTINGTLTQPSGTVTFTGAVSEIAGAGVGSTVFNAITIDPGATLISTPGTLNITRDFTNNGTFDPNSGTVVLSGSTLQIIGGASAYDFNHVSITNATASTSVRLETNATLRGVLTLAANSTFDVDGLTGSSILTVLSVNETAGSDASIATLPTGAAVTGNVTVQRYFNSLDDRNHFISSPVANASVSQLQASGLIVTGDFSGASSCGSCSSNGDNLKWNDETVPGNFKAGYTGFPGSSNTEVLVPTLGYDIYLWEGGTPFTINYRGPINQGPVPFTNVTYTDHGVPDSDGWNLVGNPYPSSIRWTDPSEGDWEMENIDPSVWVWDVSASLWRFHDYTSPGAGNLPGGVISTGQAFWVLADGSGDPSLTIHESAKVSLSAEYFRLATKSTRENTDGLRVALSRNDITDEAYLVLNESATKGFDRGLDAFKLQLGIEAMSVSLVADNFKLVKYATNRNDIADEIAIALTAPEGEYRLDFSALGNAGAFGEFYLHDAYLNTAAPLMSAHAFSITGNPATWQDRFFVSRKAERNAFAEVTEEISIYPNPVSASLHVEVAGGTAKAELINGVGAAVQPISMQTRNGISTGEIDMRALPAGVYFVKIITENQVVKTHKVLKY